MNVYDFDETIFHPDSSYAFVLYCLRHYPRAVLSTMPAVAWKGSLYALNKLETRELKETVFSFLPFLDDPERIVLDFWEENRGGIAAWYLAQKRPEDLIISASPAFLLQPAADYLGVSLIATPMDIHTGKIIGRNCHDEEKVRRFREQYPDAAVEEFYSDSLSDAPIARLAEKAWMVRGQERVPWPIKSLLE